MRGRAARGGAQVKKGVEAAELEGSGESNNKARQARRTALSRQHRPCGTDLLRG